MCPSSGECINEKDVCDGDTDWYVIAKDALRWIHFLSLC